MLLCLALTVLERADAQITLGRLAEGIIVAAGDERLAAAGVTFELSGREERSDLVAVVRLLLELGVLARVAGDEDAFVRDAGDVLYDVERRVLAVLITAPRGPSTIVAQDFTTRLRELTAEPEPLSDDLRTRAIRHQLTRRLLDNPVLYYNELSEAELAYLTSQRSALAKRICERAGLVAEIRAEGIAMVDPRDELTDVRMPEVGTDGHVALLITEYLAARADDGSGCPTRELHALVRRLADGHQAYWRRSTRDPGAEVGLVEHALERLAALRLIHRADDTIHPLPALARFGLGGADTPIGHRGTRVNCLPAPARERWQPLRLGLVDLFYYDHEVFDFRDGRLLLRGNNGTGKSKVLALTLPFLLDGDLSAHRVEPDADPNKRMEWNLLLGGEHPNDERLGYAGWSSAAGARTAPCSARSAAA